MLYLVVCVKCRVRTGPVETGRFPSPGETEQPSGSNGSSPVIL